MRTMEHLERVEVSGAREVSASPKAMKATAMEARKVSADGALGKKKRRETSLF